MSNLDLVPPPIDSTSSVESSSRLLKASISLVLLGGALAALSLITAPALFYLGAGIAGLGLLLLMADIVRRCLHRQDTEDGSEALSEDEPTEPPPPPPEFSYSKIQWSRIEDERSEALPEAVKDFVARLPEFPDSRVQWKEIEHEGRRYQARRIEDSASDAFKSMQRTFEEKHPESQVIGSLYLGGEVAACPPLLPIGGFLHVGQKDREVTEEDKKYNCFVSLHRIKTTIHSCINSFKEEAEGETSPFKILLPGMEPVEDGYKNLSISADGPKVYNAVITEPSMEEKTVEEDGHTWRFEVPQSDPNAASLREQLENDFSVAYGQEADTTRNEIFDWLDQAVRGKSTVLVHCQQGRSRSTALLLDYFTGRCGLTALEAMRLIWNARPSAESKYYSLFAERNRPSLGEQVEEELQQLA